jgi:AraC-like DNA-binding protein
MSEILKNIREINQIGAGTREYLVHPSQCPAFDHFGLLLAGISLGTRQFQFTRKSPNMAQALVGLAGKGQVLVKGQWKTCAPGMAYITPAHQLHAYRGVGNKRWKVGWAIYRGDKLPADSALASLEEPVLISVDPRPWEQVLQGLVIEAGQQGDPILLEHWTGLLHGYASRMMQTSHSARLWRLWSLIQKDLAYRWTLDELASKSGLEKENLRRICRSETGRSPMQQVTHLRMQHAVSLLASSQKVLSVAATVGYENMFAFSTAFKRVMGRSPRQFRAMAREVVAKN